MRQGAVILMTNKEGEVLWQKRDSNPTIRISYPGYWNLPSGGWEEGDGDDMRRTAARELFEETGYRADVEEFRELFISIQDNPVKGPVERHVFCIRYDGEQPILSLEGERMEFHSLQEVNQLGEVFQDHVEFVRRYEEEVFRGKERKG